MRECRTSAQNLVLLWWLLLGVVFGPDQAVGLGARLFPWHHFACRGATVDGVGGKEALTKERRIYGRASNTLMSWFS